MAKPRPIDEGFDPNNPTEPFQRWVKNLQRWLYDQKAEHKHGERKPKVTDFIALGHANDPFYIGGAAPEKLGRWFKAVWDRLDLGKGVHVRRLHYRCLDLDPPLTKLNGMQYKNVTRDWATFELASKYARVLGMVPADYFEDHRNPAAITPAWIHRLDLGVHPQVGRAEVRPFSLPDVWLSGGSLYRVEEPQATGYDYDDFADRAAYCEIWVEKSTVNDILARICRELGVALVPAAGVQSITAAINLLQRARRLDKPARVFYVSDHDDAGLTMPLSVSRHIEFWKRKFWPDADVALNPLVLTAEQIRKYDLPTNVDGGTSVELDALEGRNPGELAKIVRNALAPYHDGTLDERRCDTKAKAERKVARAWEKDSEHERAELDDLADNVQQIIEKYRPKIEKMNERMQKELQPLREPIETAQAALTRKAFAFEVDLPDRPKPQIETDESDWLFNSSRTYLEQNEFYQAWKKARAARRVIRKKKKT